MKLANQANAVAAAASQQNGSGRPLTAVALNSNNGNSVGGKTMVILPHSNTAANVSADGDTGPQAKRFKHDPLGIAINSHK